MMSCKCMVLLYFMIQLYFRYIHRLPEILHKYQRTNRVAAMQVSRADKLGTDLALFPRI